MINNQGNGIDPGRNWEELRGIAWNCAEVKGSQMRAIVKTTCIEIPG